MTTSGTSQGTTFGALDVQTGGIFTNDALRLVRVIYMESKSVPNPKATDTVRYAAFDLNNGGFQGAGSCSRRRMYEWAGRRLEAPEEMRQFCLVLAKAYLLDVVAAQVKGAMAEAGIDGETAIADLAQTGGLGRLLGLPVEIVSDDEIESRLEAAATSPLSASEAQVVLCARDTLGGEFAINNLVAALRETPGHLSNRALRNLAAVWETRGWLTPAPDAASPRRLTPELIEYAVRRVEIDAAQTAREAAQVEAKADADAGEDDSPA